MTNDNGNNDYWEIDIAQQSFSSEAPFSANDDIIISFVTAGDRGYQGFTGYTGFQGWQGYTGYTGFQGLYRIPRIYRIPRMARIHRLYRFPRIYRISRIHRIPRMARIHRIYRISRIHRIPGISRDTQDSKDGKDSQDTQDSKVSQVIQDSKVIQVSRIPRIHRLYRIPRFQGKDGGFGGETFNYKFDDDYEPVIQVYTNNSRIPMIDDRTKDIQDLNHIGSVGEGMKGIRLTDTTTLRFVLYGINSVTQDDGHFTG